MNIPKNLINLLGVVVVVGVVVAGVCLVALPLYGASQSTDSQARTVAQSNDVYEIQVQQLSGHKERMAEITASLGELRREIAAIPQLDDVYEIIVAAAADTGVTITSVTAADPEEWVPRVPGAADDGTTGDAAAPPAAGPALSPTAPAADSPAPGAGAAGPEPAAPSGDVPADASAAQTSPQRQIPLTIAVEAADAMQASAFMDALGRGPRLIAPTDGTLDDGVLTVSALVFIRTEE